MGLQDKLDAMKKEFLAKAPREAIETMGRATADLRNSGIMDRVVMVGEKAPDFSLNNGAGQTLSLSGLLAKGPAVLNIYRGKW